MIEQDKKISEAVAVTMASDNQIVIFAQGPALEKSINLLLANGWILNSCDDISGGKKVVFVSVLVTRESLHVGE